MIRSGVRDGPVRRTACVALASLLFLSGLTGTLLGQSAQTVVVVPFVNISGQLDDDWLGAGIAETVTTELERVAGLSVAGRWSVLGGEATGLDEQTVRAAARDAGMSWLVAGGYQRFGDQLRITARIVNVEANTVAKTVKVDGEVGQLFDLQDQVVDALTTGFVEILGVPELARADIAAPPAVAPPPPGPRTPGDGRRAGVGRLARVGASRGRVAWRICASRWGTCASQRVFCVRRKAARRGDREHIGRGIRARRWKTEGRRASRDAGLPERAGRPCRRAGTIRVHRDCHDRRRPTATRHRDGSWCPHGTTDRSATTDDARAVHRRSSGRRDLAPCRPYHGVCPAKPARWGAGHRGLRCLHRVRQRQHLRRVPRALLESGGPPCEPQGPRHPNWGRRVLVVLRSLSRPATRLLFRGQRVRHSDRCHREPARWRRVRRAGRSGRTGERVAVWGHDVGRVVRQRGSDRAGRLHGRVGYSVQEPALSSARPGQSAPMGVSDCSSDSSPR